MSGVTARGEFGSEILERAAGLCQLPGEKVRVDARRRGALTPGHPELTVKETIVADAGQGPEVFYTFEEIDGEHGAAKFTMSRPFENVYGVLSKVDDAFWVVPVTSDKPVSQAGEPRLLAGELNRHSRYCFGTDDAGFFKHVEEEPGVGEFVLVDLGDGRWLLDFSPWWTGADANELGIAAAAVAKHTLAEPAAYFGAMP